MLIAGILVMLVQRPGAHVPQPGIPIYIKFHDDSGRDARNRGAEERASASAGCRNVELGDEDGGRDRHGGDRQPSDRISRRACQIGQLAALGRRLAGVRALQRPPAPTTEAPLGTATSCGAVGPELSDSIAGLQDFQQRGRRLSASKTPARTGLRLSRSTDCWPKTKRESTA